MDNTTPEAESVGSAWDAAVTATADALPQLAVAVLLLLAGWIVARVLRSVTNRIGGNINRLLERLFKSGPLANARVSPAAIAVIAEFFFWAVIFITVTMAARVAGFSGLSAWFRAIVEHIPNLLLGATIIAVGYFCSILIGESASAAAGTTDVRRSALVGRLVQSAIFITALIVGLDQVGVNVSFLATLLSVAVGTIFLGFSIAFALGARDFVSNLIGTRSVRRELSKGQHVRIGDIEGEILEITPTHLAIDTVDGKALVPAGSASTTVITTLSEPAAKDTANG